MKAPTSAALAAAAIIVAGPATAHTGHGMTQGLAHGLAHPILGTDHLLAMLAVGLWSGFALRSRVWAGAATFMGAMLIGAGASWAGVGFSAAETWITLSVLVFGALTFLARRDQPRALTLCTLGAIASFAFAHGHAHAAETAGHAATYLAGFLVSTAALHLAGAGLARRISGRGHARLFQAALGAGIAAGGLALLAG